MWLLAFMACEQEYVLSGAVDVNPAAVTECPFSRVENTSFYAYDCNPVFPPVDEAGTPVTESWYGNLRTVAFHVTHVADHPFYQAWYVGESAGDYGLGYAISEQGTQWSTHPENPLLGSPGASAWDGEKLSGLQVVWDARSAGYVMLYQGLNSATDTWGLGVASSPDGHTWQRTTSGPVIDFTSSVMGLRWCWPLGLTATPSGLTGYIGGSPYDALADLRDQTCAAYPINAIDVNNWMPNPSLQVFDVGPEGAWDDQGISSMAIAELDGKRYLFYSAFYRWICYPSGWTSDDHSTCDFTDDYRTADGTFFGYAVEENGMWVRQGQVPLHVDGAGKVGAVGAQTVGSRIHLWINDRYGENNAIGYFLFDPQAAAEEDGK